MTSEDYPSGLRGKQKKEAGRAKRRRCRSPTELWATTTLPIPTRTHSMRADELWEFVERVRHTDGTDWYFFERRKDRCWYVISVDEFWGRYAQVDAVSDGRY